MDIHAPEGPTNSFKDFAIHIVIVTIGIVIALGLEGIRETIHEHHQIHETREIFHGELVENRKQLTQQRRALEQTVHNVDALIANLDELNKQPGSLTAAVDKLSPGFYFFTTSSWESALSTGVLGHMTPGEVERFASATIAVRDYVGVQDQAVLHFYELEAIFHAHPTLSPQALEEGRQKLLLFRFYCGSMSHLLDELEASTNSALTKN